MDLPVCVWFRGKPMKHLHLQVDAACVPLFYPLFEKGVVIIANTGCTLRDFLCNQMGISGNYLDQRIQTLFLDARPVDDVDKAVVRDGSVLALSAAMPGLLGATMRKGGRYAALRKDISQPAGECGICPTSGRVTLKLFNMVIGELAGRLLEAGVEVDGGALERIARRHPELLPRGIRTASMDGHSLAPDTDFFSSLSKGRRVRLSVSVAKRTPPPL